MRAQLLLRNQALELMRQRHRAPDGSLGFEACSGRVDKQALEAALDLILLALSLVMAGTGHLPTLQLLRAGLKRVQGGNKPASFLPHQVGDSLWLPISCACL